MATLTQGFGMVIAVPCREHMNLGGRWTCKLASLCWIPGLPRQHGRESLTELHTHGPFIGIYHIVCFYYILWDILFLFFTVCDLIYLIYMLGIKEVTILALLFIILYLISMLCIFSNIYSVPHQSPELDMGINKRILGINGYMHIIFTQCISKILHSDSSLIN